MPSAWQDIFWICTQLESTAPVYTFNHSADLFLVFSLFLSFLSICFNLFLSFSHSSLGVLLTILARFIVFVFNEIVSFFLWEFLQVRKGYSSVRSTRWLNFSFLHTGLLVRGEVALASSDSLWVIKLRGDGSVESSHHLLVRSVFQVTSTVRISGHWSRRHAVHFPAAGRFGSTRLHRLLGWCRSFNYFLFRFQLLFIFILAHCAYCYCNWTSLSLWLRKRWGSHGTSSGGSRDINFFFLILFSTIIYNLYFLGNDPLSALGRICFTLLNLFFKLHLWLNRC